MNESTVYDEFNGYNAYPLATGEQLVRTKLIALFEKIINKNETCLIKAQNKGLEKLFSRILAVKKRMVRIKSEMEHIDHGAEYRFEKITENDESAIRKVDVSLESTIGQCMDLIDSLTCMETDMHISERFAMMDSFLREIEHLFHRRMEIFKKMRVYG
jgi:hypothetical protein